MHDSEQEHSGITGCRVTYESTIFYNEANKFSIIVVKTSDPRIPPQACSGRYYGDRMLRFTAVGYELPRTKAVELELERMNRVLDMLKYKCWYYEEAIKDGNEDRLIQMAPEEMPAEIRRAFENAHQ